VPRARRRLTGRALALLAVLAVTGLSSALPMREYLAQRGAIDELVAQQEQARATVRSLEAERARLSDPAFVAAEARRRLDFVLPGETPYVLVGPSGAPGPGAGAAPSAPQPFYAELWDSVRSADRPPVTATPSPGPAAPGRTDPVGVPTLPPSPGPR